MWASTITGRITPSPEGAYLWLGLTMWLAMHANLRANAATTHMLTRFVRRMDKRTKQQLQHWMELSFGSIHFCGSLNPSIHQSINPSIHPSFCDFVDQYLLWSWFQHYFCRSFSCMKFFRLPIPANWMPLGLAIFFFSFGWIVGSIWRVSYFTCKVDIGGVLVAC